MAYVYRHIRLDKNEPFYIGIGWKKNYRRAYEKYGRSSFWNKIANKTAFYVDILFDNITIFEAKIKEVEFISIYGRIKDGGILCNISLGGDGTPGRSGDLCWNYGVNLSQQTKDKIRKSLIGRKHSIGRIHNMAVGLKGRKLSNCQKSKMTNKKIGEQNSRYKWVINIETGIFYSIKEASFVSGIKYDYLKCMLNGKNKNKTSFVYACGGSETMPKSKCLP